MKGTVIEPIVEDTETIKIRDAFYASMEAKVKDQGGRGYRGKCCNNNLEVKKHG